MRRSTGLRGSGRFRAPSTCRRDETPSSCPRGPEAGVPVAPGLKAEARSANFTLRGFCQEGARGGLAWQVSVRGGPGDLPESRSGAPQPHPTQLKLRLRPLPHFIPPARASAPHPPPVALHLGQAYAPSPSHPRGCSRHQPATGFLASSFLPAVLGDIKIAAALSSPQPTRIHP